MGVMDEAGPLERAVASVGDRWSLLLVSALLDGPLRFGELAEAVPGVAPNILTRRLRHLEHEGLVVATPYSRRPLRVTYELTGTGRDLPFGPIISDSPLGNGSETARACPRQRRNSSARLGPRLSTRPSRGEILARPPGSFIRTSFVHRP